MSVIEKTYTYRCGEKIELTKSLDQIVTRSLPAQLNSNDPTILTTEQVSSASTRITTDKKNLEQAMTSRRSLAPTHHAYFEAETGEEFLITDRVFIIFQTSQSNEQIDDFCRQYSLLKQAQYSSTEFLFQLTTHTGMNPVKLVVSLTENNPNVTIAENDLNQRMTTYQSLDLPQDPEYKKQWHLHTHHNHAEFDPRSSTLCEEAWKLLNNFGDEDVVVCIADDGCKLDHGDFNSAHKFADWGYFKGHQLIRRDATESNPTNMYQAGSNHGTSCAGVIAGEMDAVLTVGAAPNCRLLPIKWESSGKLLFISDSKLLTVLTDVGDKIDVMSNSWGITPINMTATPVLNKIKTLQTSGGRRGKGIVFLWAAGNENCLINYTADQNVPYTNGWLSRTEWGGVRSTNVFKNNLTELANVMHIGALASTAQRSHYSNYGQGLTLSAPSNNSHYYRRMSLKGLAITTATGQESGVTHNFGGTSSATPLVAGIAALVISAYPELTALEVIELLNQTADKNLDFTGYPTTASVSFDNDTNWDVSPIIPFDHGTFVTNPQDSQSSHGTWSPWFGYGRVNAKAAVAAALQQKSDVHSTVTSRSFQATTSPNISIPDNAPLGITSILSCDKPLLLQTIHIEVDITHPYIGDLSLILTSPSGTTIVLHARHTGGSDDNLQRVYTTSNTPELHQLANTPCLGDWVLQVQDLAAQDTGHFNHWSLDLTGITNNAITINDHAGVRIPDNQPQGIERTIVITETGKVASIAVMIDINHSYIGDLLIALINPNGETVVLHNRSGGSENNIVVHYTTSNTPALATLLGQAINGDWRLQVIDQESRDIGKLNVWQLDIIPE